MTRSAARAVAASHSTARSALAISEILEMVLLHTDMRTLLTSCQLVCREWRSLVARSLPIQKALFFTPIQASEWAIKETVPNPLLAEKFPTVFPAPDDSQSQLRFFELSNCAMTKDSETLDRFCRNNASWRRMLVQQPPIWELGVFHVLSRRGGPRVFCASIPVGSAIDNSSKTKGLSANQIYLGQSDEAR